MFELSTKSIDALSPDVFVARLVAMFVTPRPRKHKGRGASYFEAAAPKCRAVIGGARTLVGWAREQSAPN